MQAHNAEPRRLVVTREEAMQMLGCKKSTLHNLMKEGHFEIKKLGTRTLITVSSLEKFIEGLPTIPAKI